jgi:hypothetical protein
MDTTEMTAKELEVAIDRAKERLPDDLGETAKRDEYQSLMREYYHRHEDARRMVGAYWITLKGLVSEDGLKDAIDRMWDNAKEAAGIIEDRCPYPGSPWTR